MGKRIDRAALCAVTAAALYLFFAAAFRSVWAGAACALCAMLLLRHALRGLFGRLPRPKRRRSRARAEVEMWATLPAREAEARARSLLEKAYPAQLEGARVEVALRHPSGPALDVNALLEMWRARQGEERLALVVTSRVSGEALALARTLSRPTVRVADAEQIASLLERFPPQGEPPAPARRRIRIRIGRERAPRRLLFGLLLLGMYLLLGNPLYLASGLATLFLGAMGLKKPPVPKRLFD